MISRNRRNHSNLDDFKKSEKSSNFGGFSEIEKIIQFWMILVN